MKVKFIPQNIELEIKPNQTVLNLAHENGVHIQSVCKGVPSCAECRVQIAEGENNVFPPTKKELNLIGTAHFLDQSRLACQLKCFGDLTIDLTSQIEKAQNAKRPRGKFSKDPAHTNAVTGSILLEESTQPAGIETPAIGTEDYNLRKAEKIFREEELRLELERIKKRKEHLASDDENER